MIIVQGGDIGDLGRTQSRRVVLVWEGVCATRPLAQHPSARERLARLRGKEESWDRVVRSWQLHLKPLQRIYAMQVRGVYVDIWTFEGYEFGNALRDYLDALYVDVNRVEYFENAEAAARALRISPEIEYVVDSDPDRLAIFGKRGLAAAMGDDWGQYL